MKYAHIKDPFFIKQHIATLAIDTPDKKFLEHLYNAYATHTLINLGVTFLHPSDQFVKKIGREEAEKKAAWVKCQLESVKCLLDKKVFHFSADYSGKKGTTHTLVFGLRINAHFNEACLVYANIYN